MSIKSSSHLDHYVKVRLNQRDYLALMAIKARTDLSISDLVRQQLKPILA